LRPLSDRRRLGGEWIGQVLGERQERELRMARVYPECQGLSREQLEDIYQEASVALLTRPYQSEEHLLNALRQGIKHRALNLHRDERRRRRILSDSAPGIYAVAEASADVDAPELAAIVRQDRLIVSEFLTELSPVEQRVFWLLAEGMRYRAIAPALGLEVNAARNASRAVERKRERFQLLYDTGRLCGYRSATIRALQIGQATTEELAERAFAHLEGCAHCRAEHKTNARRLRSRFQGQAAALLPMPAFASHFGWITRARGWVERLLPGAPPVGPGGVRDGAIAVIAGGGVGAKVAATVATVVVIAGSTTAGVVIDQGSSGHHHSHRARASAHRQAALAPARPSPEPIVRASAAASTPISEPTRTSSSRDRARAASSGKRSEPGGFAYLGVPSSHSSTAATARATTASAASTPNAGGGESSSGVASSTSHGGGEFSP
jgi:RNA polymerase sigma factor (sigma-70 family)